MTPAEFRQAGETLYGKNWRSEMAAIFCVDYATVRRWATGDVRLPGAVCVALRLLLDREGGSGSRI